MGKRNRESGIERIACAGRIYRGHPYRWHMLARRGTDDERAFSPRVITTCFTPN